jgi:DeoR family suf operon transcriptional repressor
MSEAALPVAARSPLQALGERQRALLQCLQRHKDGRSADELAADLGITPTAVRQHLAALERDGYLHRGESRRTGGRPGFVYRLSPGGRELFPRKYSWFSGLLLGSLESQQGSEGLADYLRGMARNLANSVTAAQPALGATERVALLGGLMNELGYDAEVGPRSGEEVEVRAHNCIYHDLAAEYPALCAFDVELIGSISGQHVEHVECMVRGGQSCRFRLTSR